MFRLTKTPSQRVSDVFSTSCNPCPRKDVETVTWKTVRCWGDSLGDSVQMGC